MCQFYGKKIYQNTTISFWLLFILISILTSLSVSNVGLAINRIVFYILSYGVLIYGYNVYNSGNKRYQLLKIFRACFWLFLTATLISICVGLEMNSNWNDIFGSNKNYTSAYLSSLLVFVIFNNYKTFSAVKNTVIHSTAIVFVAFVVFETNSLGALICLLINTVLFLLIKCDRKRQFNIKILIIAVLSIIIFLISGIYYEVFGERMFEFRRAIAVLNETSWISGVGAGGWFSYMHNLDLSESSLSHPYFFIRWSPHNLYLLIIVETGILGLLSFLYFIFKLFYNAIRSNYKINTNNFASVVFVINFLILSTFYSSAFWCSINSFSELYILAIINMSLIITSFDHKFSVKLFPVVIVSILLFYFSIRLVIKHKYSSIDLKSNILLSIFYGNISEKETYESYIIKKSDLSNNSNLKNYFEISLKKDKSDLELILNYSNYALNTLNEIDIALNMAKRAQRISPNNIEVNLCLAEVFYKIGEIDSSSFYFNKIPYVTIDLKKRYHKMKQLHKSE